MPPLSTHVDPRPLALARIGVATVLNAVEGGLQAAGHDAGRCGAAAGELAVTGVGIAAYAVVVLSAGLALVLGVATRAAAAVVAFSTWFLFAWEQQTYSNHLMLTAWLALWLVFTPSDAAWAWSRRASRDGRGVVTLGDQVLLMCQLCACYFFAALVKLNAGFLSGDHLRAFVNLELPSWLWVSAAVGTVVTELGLVVGLWFRRTRRIAALAGVVLHLSIPLAMPGNLGALSAFSLQCLSLYPLFLLRPTGTEESDRPKAMALTVPSEPSVGAGA